MVSDLPLISDIYGLKTFSGFEPPRTNVKLPYSQFFILYIAHSSKRFGVVELPLIHIKLPHIVSVSSLVQ